MKFIYSLLIVSMLGLAAKASSASCAMGSMLVSDTIVFDLSQAEFTSVDAVTYMEFPIELRTPDASINAVDYWLQFDTNKLTYVSTTSTLSSLDVYSNFNTTSQFLSNTSSTTSISVYLPSYDPIMKLKFSLVYPCADISSEDFFTPTALINGIVSTFLVVDPGVESSIQITSGAVCAPAEVSFSYPSDINGQPITSYAWDFGNEATATGQTPTTVYTEEGTFPVTLQVSTDIGCTDTITTDVVVAPVPVAEFSNTYDDITNIFTFTNISTISTGTIAEYFWDFGDDSTSTAFETSHGYASAGFYAITLSVTSDLGCTSNMTHTVVAPIGITELENRTLLDIYPNPASSELNIRSSETMQVYIIDETGRRVTAEQRIGANQNAAIALDHLVQGIYIAVGNNGNEMVQKRFEILR